MKIGFFEVEKWEEEPLRKAFPRDKLVFSKGKLGLGKVKKYKDLEVVSGFVYSEVTDKLLKRMPRLFRVGGCFYRGCEQEC